MFLLISQSKSIVLLSKSMVSHRKPIVLLTRTFDLPSKTIHSPGETSSKQEHRKRRLRRPKTAHGRLEASTGVPRVCLGIFCRIHGCQGAGPFSRQSPMGLSACRPLSSIALVAPRGRIGAPIGPSLRSATMSYWTNYWKKTH